MENLYHSGLAKFANAPILGARVAGAVAPFPQGNHGVQPDGQFITELLGDQASFQAPPRVLNKSYAEFARLGVQVPCHVRRLSYLDGYLPGYGPGQNAPTTASALYLRRSPGNRACVCWIATRGL